MDVRAANKQNLPQLLELWEERQVLLQQADSRFASYIKDRNQLQRHLLNYFNESIYILLVALHERQPIGFIVGEVGMDNIGKILLMALDAHQYHAGVGRQLYRALRQNLVDRGMTEIAVVVPRFHAVEQAFWRSMGGQEFIVTDEVDEKTVDDATGVHVDDVIIRKAIEDDVDRIGALWKKLVTYHRGLDEQLPEAAEDGGQLYARHLLNRLTDQYTQILVAENDGEVVGFIFGIIVDLVPEMFIAETGGFLADIFVEEAYRGRGVGRDLVDALSKWFRGRGVGYVELYVANKNSDARAFWDKMGARDLMTRLRFNI